MTHMECHPLTGQTVTLNLALDTDIRSGDSFRVEDWWDHLTGGSWMAAEGNPAAMKYAIRAGLGSLPMDDDVIYGKVGAFGHLVHLSELGEVVE